jgi:hypothetical protein
MLCIGVNKTKIHFDTSQLCCGVVHYPIFQYSITPTFQAAYTVGLTPTGISQMLLAVFSICYIT